MNQMPDDATTPTPDDTKLLTLLIVIAYLCVFVGNGQMTLPLFLVLPAVLAEIGSAKAVILIPCLLGASGLLMVLYRFIPSTSRAMHYTVIVGKVLLGISLVFFASISASDVITILTCVPFFMLAYRNVIKQNAS